MATPAGSDTVRYGIIGVGMMGLEHLRDLAAVPGAAVTAVSDPHEGSRVGAVDESGRAGLPRPAVFVDHRDLLASGLCDAVVVASPNMTHAAVLDDVLDAGLHVLVEKPLCTTVADCRRTIDKARDHPGVVWVGLEYRYMPPVAALIADVASGGVGRVHMVAIREHRFPFLPKVGDWNRFNRNTGGTLVEKCCHFFDLMNLVSGGRPTRVLASGAQSVNHIDERYDGEQPDILDNALVIVEYDNGVRASLDLCMFAEGSRNQEELSVVGDTGKVEAFLPSGVLRTGARTTGWPGVSESVVGDDRVAHEGFHHGSSYLEHLAFLDAVRTGLRADVSLEDGLLSMAVGVAAQRSIAEERAVTLDEVLAG
ncbi:MAG TPA: Gfo/Idh/MocA family oxidoreductase [Acidimicrobiales bacterium]